MIPFYFTVSKLNWLFYCISISTAVWNVNKDFFMFGTYACIVNIITWINKQFLELCKAFWYQIDFKYPLLLSAIDRNDFWNKIKQNHFIVINACIVRAVPCLCYWKMQPAAFSLQAIHIYDVFYGFSRFENIRSDKPNESSPDMTVLWTVNSDADVQNNRHRKHSKTNLCLPNFL